MKYVVIVPDGMFDHPLENFDNRTPLEIARTPNMDYLARNGMSGLVQTIPDKLPPGSDVGNMAILGYNPEISLTGRSPLEAANMGIDLKEDEIAFRCNMITEMNGIMADYSAGHIRTEEAAILIEALKNHLGTREVKFYAGKSYRHIMVLKTTNLNEFLAIKTVPPHDIIDQPIEKYLPHGPLADKLIGIMEQSKAIFAENSINQVRIDLKENPATMIWLWGQGTKPNLIPFKKKYGISGSIISAVDLVNGLGRLAGLNVIDVPGATGYYDTNYQGKADYAMESLKKHDYVYIHIESPDEAGHNGDAQAKIEAIEKIDKYVVGTVLNHFGDHPDARILVLPDHPTPVVLRTHTHEPVGFAMYGRGIPPSGVDSYTESSTQEIGMKFKSGEEMIEYFIKKNL
ncbi:MAG: cofactor-independent phosphoglycerate mutase [Candidatus Omnitrophica bacterium]|nr:cofactor-independent phosphoglycerate mutase [Candidatus Omnitrophota bacterium]